MGGSAFYTHTQKYILLIATYHQIRRARADRTWDHDTPKREAREARNRRSLGNKESLKVKGKGSVQMEEYQESHRVRSPETTGHTGHKVQTRVRW